VVVGARHDPAQEVAATRDRVDLQHLGDLAQVGGDVEQAALGDLQADESEHLVAHGAEVEVGVEPADDLALLELVEARLDGAARHPQLPGQLHHAGPRDLTQRPDEARIQGVDPRGQHEQVV
jgi:hypothetical protein